MKALKNVIIYNKFKFFTKAQNVLKGNIIDSSIMNLSLLIFIVGTGLLAAKDMKYAITKFGKQFVILAIFFLHNYMWNLNPRTSFIEAIKPFCK